jgi:hypothetical protein
MPLSLIRPSVFQRPSQLTQAQGQLLKGLKRFLQNGPQKSSEVPTNSKGGSNLRLVSLTLFIHLLENLLPRGICV